MNCEHHETMLCQRCTKKLIAVLNRFHVAPVDLMAFSEGKVTHVILEEHRRFCSASCCCGDTDSDLGNELCTHDMQMICDMNGRPSGSFGEDHQEILELMLEATTIEENFNGLQ